MQTKIPDSVQITADEQNPDTTYELLVKSQRNAIEKLNHYFRVSTHPFVLTIILILLGLIFSVFYIMAESTDIIWVSPAAELIGKILSYVATAVFSSVFTWFMESHSKIKSDSEL